MDFLEIRLIKSKLKKSIFRKSNIEQTIADLHAIARRYEGHKLYPGYCYLTIARICPKNSIQVGAYLNAARSFAKDSSTKNEQSIRTAVWLYQQAVTTCDDALKRPIMREMGDFYMKCKLNKEAAGHYKESGDMQLCVDSLVLSKSYGMALKELQNCAIDSLTPNLRTTTFLLAFLLSQDILSETYESLMPISSSNRDLGIPSCLCTDDQANLCALLESLLIIYKSESSTMSRSLKVSIIDELYEYLDPTQSKILYQIYIQSNLLITV